MISFHSFNKFTDVAKVLDKIQALYQGRPPSLRESDTRVPLNFWDDYEELETFHPLSYTTTSGYSNLPKYNISVFQEFCRLSILMDRIFAKLYTEKSMTKDPDNVLQELKSVHVDLEHWYSNLPPHMKSDYCESPGAYTLPHTLSLL